MHDNQPENSKTVRLYYSKNVDASVNIDYVKNGNKVPKSDGAKPLMTLPDTLPDDIDYKRYISISEELLKGVGYA